MCVKDFYGYNCGHCSVPVLRQCPLSASNPHYPVCRFPAERPTITNELCHPCSRVVWNVKVLKEEEEHRILHLQGGCGCEVIFDGEERQKRCPSTRGNYTGKGRENTKDGQQKDPEVTKYGTFEHEFSEAEGNGHGGGCGYEEHPYLQDSKNIVQVEDDIARGSWGPAAQMAAYEYVGYDIENGQPQNTHPGRSYAVALGCHEGGQLSMGEVGSGMKWYPNQQQQHHHFPQVRSAFPNNNTEGAPKGPRAASLPIGRYDYPRPINHKKIPVVLTQPLVVSSDMVRSESV